MATVDMKRMKKSYEEQQKSGGQFINFGDGETLIYIHPPCREGDEWAPTTGLNYVPVVVHYNIGKNNNMVMSLDPKRNTVLMHPWVQAFLKKKKIKITPKTECPIAKELASGGMSDDEADKSRHQSKSLWGITVLATRELGAKEWKYVETPKPGVTLAGKTIYDGFMDVFFDESADITNPAGATLVRVIKKGKGMKTKYIIKAEPSSLKKPYVVGKSLRAALAKEMAEGGACDLFRVAANLTKGPDEVQAILDGVATSGDPDDFDDDDEEDDEDEIKSSKKASPAKSSKSSKKTSKEDDDEEDDDEEEEDEEEEDSDDDDDEDSDEDEEESDDDDEEDDGDDDEEEEKKPVKSKKNAKDEEEGDEDEEESDDDDEEEEDEKPSKSVKKAPPSKSPKKPSKEEDEEEDDEEEEEEDDEEDEEDEEEEEKPSKSSKKAPPAKSPSPKKAEGKKASKDDDKEEFDDLEKELAELEEDEDDEEEKKSAKSSKAAPSKKSTKK